DRFAPLPSIDLGKLDAIEQDTLPGGVLEADEKIHESALAGPCRPHQGHGFVRTDAEIYAPQHVVSVEAEAQLLNLQAQRSLGQASPALVLAAPRRLAQNLFD